MSGDRIENFRTACGEVIENCSEPMRRDALSVIDNLLDLAA
jgi:hypothetical protein